MLLTATQNQPDYIALAMVAALALVIVIMVIRKHLSNKKEAARVAEPAPVKIHPKPEAPGSAGQLKLHNVEPKTAAMLMAIVADKMGKPLNELRFISIKEVE